MKECDDELFSCIDEYKKCWGESREYYERQIQIINLFYESTDKVGKLVDNNEVDRLFARMDYLSVQSDFYNNITTYFCSLAISVIASIVFRVLECENLVKIYIGMAIAIVSFLVIALFRYMQRGQDGSYLYLVNEYEKELLVEKIKEVEKKMKISKADEDALNTKRIVIGELISIRKKAKRKRRKQQIEDDIKIVEKLKLCLGDYEDCHKQMLNINGKKGCLVYDKEEGKKNNYIGEFNLKTQDYSVLYNILKKYEFIN